MGYDYKYGRCVNHASTLACDQMVQPGGLICNINLDFGPLLGGVQSVCAFGNGGGGVAIKVACNTWTADTLNATEMATGICNQAWNGLAGVINTFSLGLGGAAAAALGLQSQFVNSCISAAIPALNAAGIGSNATAPFACDPGLICNQAGNCAKGLPPAIAGGASCVNTGLGCLNFTGKSTIQSVLNWSISIAGGIAFIIIIAAAFQITTARGDAKRVQAGKELLFSALAGIFMIVLAIVLLNFLGLNVLGLQQFGFA